jgi:hypothetical protein
VQSVLGKNCSGTLTPVKWPIEAPLQFLPIDRGAEMRKVNFGTAANGRVRALDAQEPESSIIGGRSTGYIQVMRQVANRNTNLQKSARRHLQVIDGGYEWKTDFSLLIGVINALIFEVICLLAIAIVWYAGWHLR